MRILFIAESYGASLYGVAQVIVHIIRNSSGAGFAHRILAYSLDSKEESGSFVRRLPVYAIGMKRTSLGRMLRFHHKMTSVMKTEIHDFCPDVVHVHGALTFIQAIGVIAGKRCNVPTLLSPHGMLEPWLWKQKGPVYYWLKRSYWQLFLKSFIGQVNFIHAITDQESESLNKEFPGIKQIKIPNAVDLSEFEVNQIAPDADRYLLFMGRLHPVKGVDLLIHAFNSIPDEGVRLVIAGPDYDAEYTSRLKSLVEKLDLSERVSFVGSVSGEIKSELFRKAWCTMVPSYSEVMALVNLESAASYTPTITTTMTGLSDWEVGGGLLVEPEVSPLTAAIKKVCDWSIDERMQMGRRSRVFVEERYSWDVIGKQWMDAYQMIGETGKVKK